MHRLLLYLQFFACLADADYGKDGHQESQNRRHRVKVRIGNENGGGRTGYCFGNAKRRCAAEMLYLQ